MKIKESILRNIIKEEVNNLLREEFSDNEISRLAKEHGGVDNIMRDITVDFPIEHGKYKKANFIESDVFNRFPLSIKMFLCTSGIAFKDGSYLYLDRNDVGFDNNIEFSNKTSDRNKNYRMDLFNDKPGEPAKHKENKKMRNFISKDINNTGDKYNTIYRRNKKH